MENNAKNLKEILENDYYVIPRYQRNYAWARPEISQLIKDIDEFFPKENSGKKAYYLGSLVCFKREDGSFELIDGQQRQTTIALLNLVLKNWTEKIENTVALPNLKFDSRGKIQNYIETLYQAEEINFLRQADELNFSGAGRFKDAIETIQEELRGRDVKNFSRNFYKNVYLFRVEVPEGTDLNHYFEIMNSRGEQLEKHEIVKSLLMGKISEAREQEIFSKIWDACADMGHYVYLNIDMANRKAWFDAKGELKVTSFGQIVTEHSLSNEDVGRIVNERNNDKDIDTLDWIIRNHTIPHDFSYEKKTVEDRYRSIINFPNFLLQVLKVRSDTVSLDDKKLLEQFGNARLDPREFAFDLLKYRVLFDRFVVKQDLSDADENKQNWGIRKLSTDFEATVKTFEEDEELAKLQLMLYYSNSANTYNSWLQEILKSGDFSLNKYTEKIWTIAKGKFSRDKLEYSNISVFNLYFIDFLLWKLYKAEVVSENLKLLKSKIDRLKGHFNSFKFIQISSREHLLSQVHAKRYDLNEEVYNGIGNLCLISPSQNSAGNKEHPTDKKKMFKHDNSSLKRLVMFESYENDNWESEQIIKHELEIEMLIKETCMR